MFNKPILLRIISLFILIVTPFLTYRLGLWETALIKEAARTFEYASMVWKLLLINVFIVAWWLLIAWLVAFRRERESIIAIVYVVFGLVLTFLPLISFVANTDSPLLHWLMEPPVRGIRMALMSGGSSSPTNLSSLFVLLVGVLGLHPKRKPEQAISTN